jgi:3-deoxy-D-manno-octulosonate 8-phosphate phosphatase (KDO 8-P phosphatase)
VSGALSKTRLVALDVDGVLTDGRFYLSDDGRETKAFSTQDGFGIRRLLNAGVRVAIISGRQSAAVTLRMQELGVQHVFLGCKDKVAVFDALIAELGIDAADTVYVGDDVPDLQLLQKVGTPIAVANAVQEVRDFCKISTRASGGFGAVREVCDMVLAALPD